MVLKLPSDNWQRKTVTILVKIIAATVLMAIATWRLGLLLDLELEDLHRLLLLGLPLIGFFVGGVLCLTAFAWIIGVFPALVMRRWNLKHKLAMALASTLVTLAIVITWSLWLPERPLQAMLWVAAMISLSAAFWCLSQHLRPHLLGLLAWEMGVAAIAMLLVLARSFDDKNVLILVFVAGCAPVVSLFAPRLVTGITHPATDVNGWRWVSLSAAHGSCLSLVLPYIWFALALCVGSARAAVDVGLLPIIGVWIVVISLLASFGWLVHRSVGGFAFAVALVAILWLVSAHTGPTA